MNKLISNWPLAVFLTCSGCADTTVQSIDVSLAAPKDRTGTYMDYGVAKSLIVVQLSAAGAADASGAKLTPPAAKSAKGSPAPGGADAAAAGAAAAATNQTWTLSGTLTSGATPKDDASKAPQTPDTSRCGLLSSAYQARQGYAGVLANTYADVTKRLEEMAAGTPDPSVGKAKSPDDPATLANDAYAYVKLATSKGIKVNSDSAKSILNLYILECPPTIKVSLQAQISADPTRTFALKGNPNPFYSDAIKLNSDSNGLLTTSSATTTDQTGAILSSIASDVGEFVIGAPHTIPTFKGPPAAKALPPKGCPPGGDLVADAIDDLCSSQPSARAAALALLSLLPAPPPLPPLPAGSNLPLSFALSIEDLERTKPAGDGCLGPAQPGDTTSKGHQTLDYAKRMASSCLADAATARNSALTLRTAMESGAQPAPDPQAEVTDSQTFVDDLVKAAGWISLAQSRARQDGNEVPTGLDADFIFARYGIALDTRCSQRRTAESASADANKGAAAETNDLGAITPEGAITADGVYDGLVVSASRSCRIDARQVDTGLPLANANLWLQDSRYLTLLPMQRAALVPRTVEYDFQNGSATGVSDNRPSTAAALVALPGNIAGSLVSGVTAAVTNRNTVTNDKTSQLTTQTNYLAAQTQLLNAQLALKKAQAPAGDQ